MPIETRTVRSLGAGITNSSEPPDVVAEAKLRSSVRAAPDLKH